LAEKGRKEAERRKSAEQKKRDAEQRRADEERRKKEEEDRRRMEKELAEKKAKFKKASDNDKVFSIRGQAGTVSYDDLINGFVARIEAIAKTAFGLPFLRELVKRGELNYEKSLSYYLTETRAAIKQGLAKKEKKEIKKRGSMISSMCSMQSLKVWASKNPITSMKKG
jgi:ribosomal protein S8E